MRRAIALLWLGVLVWLATPDIVEASTAVHVIETYPPGDQVTLARNQKFYLRIAYSTDSPVQIWAQPYLAGEPAKVGSNPSGTYVGSGDALGWFFFFEPGQQIDEIRIRAGDGSVKGTQVVDTWRGNVVAGNNADINTDVPEWVTRLEAASAAAQRADYERRMAEPLSTGDKAFVGGFMFLVAALGIFGIAAPIWGVYRWRGGWRIAAAVIVAGMAFVILRIVLGTALDRTSHNLWPFEIVMAGFVSSIAIVSVWVLQKLLGRRT